MKYFKKLIRNLLSCLVAYLRLTNISLIFYISNIIYLFKKYIQHIVYQDFFKKLFQILCNI
jgi:hypothetical protein